MISDKENIRISKFLSLVLRHKPESIGIELDETGWADVNTLLIQMNHKGFPITFNDLHHIVDTNNKTRFAFNNDKTKIRANQGHSVDVVLGLQPIEPPETLYHGTAEKWLTSILQQGISKQKRHHVHLSADTQTAIKVGQRHGKPVVLQVAAQRMFKNNYQFFLSENGVWLTDHVPPQYLGVLNIEKNS